MSGDNTAFFYEVFYSVCYGDANPPDAIKKLHTFSPAILHGYCRHRVKSADYPAIIQEEGHSVRGIYATGLTDANLVKLDYFEGSEYERKGVKVRLVQDGTALTGGEEKDAVAYVFLLSNRLERGEWDFEHFRKEKMMFWSSDPSDRAVVS
ncbi:AIG2-like family [Geosmithia morbida]|uniref:Putative gamma-glutamylcyclotransferase n=1 Tax=Geosmithia morbida TaxID=1094350 RepID=A0A9P5D3I4_9HYPO|nr:AIG2-like family [Geosmithia morbida]KAF4120544.1 AIG2-like family [Geosmithia morbida]